MPANTERQLTANDARKQRAAQRISNLIEHDRQFRDAAPLPAMTQAKVRPGLGLAQTVEIVMEGYADRPALGQRKTELVVDKHSGCTELRLRPGFEHITYRALWSRAKSLAASWHHNEDIRIKAGDAVCILAFAGVDYVAIDLATICLGAVMVPLQTNATVSQLSAILEETSPRCLATSLECLSTAVEAVLAGYKPASILVFDYHPGDDLQRETYQTAQKRLTDAGCQVHLASLEVLCEDGKQLASAPLSAPAEGDNPLSTIYYTSGSTGSPKGAMYLESMTRGPWLAPTHVPLIAFHYMPMNHSFGRAVVSMTLANGGTCFFTAKSDLSTLFEDLRHVRPTYLALVPRICEMMRHRFENESHRRTDTEGDGFGLKARIQEEFRNDVLGGRVFMAPFGTAPMTPELRTFMEDCLDIELLDGYGTSETAMIALNGYVQRPPVIDYKLVDVPELGYFQTDKPHPRGELLVKTSNIMAGYYKRPELTAQVFDAEGYYRTGDIMAEIEPGRISYVDRRNNVLKLAQGEFVAIAHLETIFSSGHPLIQQVYLYGTSQREFLLAVIVPRLEAATEMGVVSNVSLKASVRDAIQQIAKAEQLKPYEVPRDFLIEKEPFSIENGMLASVGKHLRPALKERYGARLEQLYTEIAECQTSELNELRRNGKNAPVIETIMRAFEAILGIDGFKPNQSASFAELGGDSLSAVEFSMLLEEIYQVEVPVGVIANPASNLEKLAGFIEKSRAGNHDRPTFASVHGRGSTHIEAHDLTLEKFIDSKTLAEAVNLPLPEEPPHTVLLTGANGFLGRFLCLNWLEKLARTGGKLICIARGADNAAAKRRIIEVFESGDVALLQHFETLAAEHLEVLAGDVGEPNLGLDESEWRRLTGTVDYIVHPAAQVNHVLPYWQLFGPNVVGTAELIRLALTERRKPFLYVSTVAAAMLPEGGCIDEGADIRIASPSRPISESGYASGYASSKWAGEVLLREAHDRFGLPVSVFRSDMILAHSRYAGQLNVPDMFTRWLYSLVVTGIAPSSFYRGVGKSVRPHYAGLPVDFIAQAMIEIASHTAHDFHTYHVLNPHDDGISLDTFVDWAIEAGCNIQRIEDYDDWLGRFETALRALPERARNSSSLPLIEQLREPMPAIAGSSTPAQRFQAAVRVSRITPQGEIPHLSADLIHKYVKDLQLLQLLSSEA